jgi:hypothetical protein
LQLGAYLTAFSEMPWSLDSRARGSLLTGKSTRTVPALDLASLPQTLLADVLWLGMGFQKELEESIRACGLELGARRADQLLGD